MQISRYSALNVGAVRQTERFDGNSLAICHDTNLLSRRNAKCRKPSSVKSNARDSTFILPMWLAPFSI
jgi:hypothetical protein